MGTEDSFDQHSHLVAQALLPGTPFPRVDSSGQLVPGLTIAHPSQCTNCGERRCAELHSHGLSPALAKTVCPRGFACFSLEIEGERVVINGLITPAETGSFSRKDKRTLEPQRVDVPTVRSWHQRVSLSAKAASAMVQVRIDNALGTLHDVETAVSSILRHAERCVSDAEGETHDEKIDNLQAPVRGLVSAVELLNLRLRLMPLLTNPDSASYGRRFRMPVYRAVDKIVRCLRPIGMKKGVRVELRGHSFNTPDAYDSITTIPLVILDNAIKYSQADVPVEVEVNDSLSGVEVLISSFSPVITSNERDRIFERGYRGSAASALASKGSGLGLYLARVVAAAHGIEINCSQAGQVVKIGDQPYCNNMFGFTIPG